MTASTATGSGRFHGLSVVVTGGAQGIGAAAAHQFTEEGGSVVILDLNPHSEDSRVSAIRCDIGDTASVNAAMQGAIEKLGGLDILVNNAGIGAQGDVTANDDDEWQRVMNINVRGPARVTAAALPHLRRSSHAAIVNVSSIAATAGLPERALYSASKGAVLSLTLAMAADCARDGIRVNAVCPGTTRTPWVDRLLASAADPAEELRQLELRQPHGRLVDPREVAEAVCFLASPQSGSTIGAALAVDGGMQGLRLRASA